MSDLLTLNPSASECPAPQVPVPRNRCRAKQCVRDSDCRRHTHRCCFNGCLFTCLPRLGSPPVIDWIKDPLDRNGTKARKENKEALEAVIAEGRGTGIVCSTAPARAPAPPLQCPEGMVCISKNTGDPLRGVPSLGECIVDPKHTAVALPVGDNEQAALESLGSETVFLPGGCILTKQQYKSIEEFKQKPYITGCTCKQGSVECKISSDNSFDRRRPKST